MRPEQILNKAILIAPLNWGLGHATRCIPLINQLIDQGNSITIAGSGNSLILLKEEFPQLPFITLNDYDVKYYCNVPMWQGMGIQTPKIISAIKEETKLLNGILSKQNFDIVISDNRYGLYNEKCTSIFITHQVYIRAGIFSGLINYINHSYIKKFNYCWVPDYEDSEQSLAGELSRRGRECTNLIYIGPLSRFDGEILYSIEKKYSHCVLISGPEPQRSTFERAVIDWANKQRSPICIIRGTTEKRKFSIKGHITLHDLVNSKEVKELILSANIVVCRSGYSTVMDLHSLNIKPVFVPTPGQTEQEYLAAYLSEKGMGKKVLQKEFELIP